MKNPRPFSERHPTVFWTLMVVGVVALGVVGMLLDALWIRWVAQ